MRLVEELKGDVINWPLVDAWEAVGSGAKPVFLGMIGVGDGSRLGVVLQCFRHPSAVTLPQPCSINIGERTRGGFWRREV